MNKIYYIPVWTKFDSLVPETKFEEDDYSYHQCPVWKHKANRTFVAIAPFDFEFSLDLENDKIIYDEVEGYSPNPLFCDDYELQTKHAIIQIKFPIYHFWTHDEVENLWFEQLDHPLTSLNNNFIVIGGWWNLVDYPRAVSVAIKVIDKNKKITIKKGDPLYRVRFYPEDLNSGIKLIQKDSIPLRINKLRALNKPSESTRSTLNKRLFSKRSKCPIKNYFNI